MSPAPAPDLSGRTMLRGRFHLLERLGAGSFGGVYRSAEAALGAPLREVAVKVTHRARLSLEEARGQLEEAFTLCRILAQCRDSGAARHFIQMHETGIADDLDGRGYIVFEYVRGTRLLDQIGTFRNGIAMSTARRYLEQLCSALRVCHSCNPPVTHGDLKPDNILVDHTGTIRVVDFGLSRPIHRLTGYAPNPGGCLAYSAPEVLLSRGLPQSDIYSLGLIMYELLTGDGPHRHMPPPPLTDVDAHFRHHKQRLQFAPLAEANQSVPQDETLFQVVERCCRFDSAERFDSVSRMLEALARPPEALRPERFEHPTATAAPAADDWRLRVEELLDQGNFEECHEWLQRVADRADSRWQCYQAICARQRKDWRAAWDVGLAPFEELSTVLPESMRQRLGTALLDAAEHLSLSDRSFQLWIPFLKDRMAMD